LAATIGPKKSFSGNNEIETGANVRASGDQIGAGDRGANETADIHLKGRDEM
jgi:hypothetical protein